MRVVGTFPLGPDFRIDGNVIVSDRTFANIYGGNVEPSARESLVELGLIKVVPGADIAATQRAVADVLPDDVRVLTRTELEGLIQNYWSNSKPVGAVFGLGMVVGFLIGVAICYQILYTDVIDHLPQYATLKALGYHNRHLVRIVLQKAVYLGVLGFVPGLIVSALDVRRHRRLLGHPDAPHDRARAGRPGRDDRDVPAVWGDCDSPRDPVRSCGGVLMDYSETTIVISNFDALAKGIEPAIQVRGVNHFFGTGETRKQVLQDNNVTLMPGEMVIMTGPSGSGKSTLLTLIGGLRRVQEGSLIAAGRELRGLSNTELTQVRRGIGFIFQAHNLFDSLTALQNVRTSLELHPEHARGT